MHRSKVVRAGLLLLAATLFATPALADDMVPVPDVRGMTTSQARAVLEEAGLRLGGTEQVDEATLKRDFGRTYAAGTVVQQAPPPSIDDQPSWLARGREVWLRIAAAPGQPSSAPAIPRPVPLIPSRPTVTTHTPTPAAPYRSASSTWTGSVPPRPPPPFSLDGSPLPSARRTVIAPPQPYQPSRPIGMAPQAPRAPVAPVAPTQPLPQAAAQAAPCFTLSCERKENGWHVRANAGVAFWAGQDSGDMGFYGGMDLGYTMCSCVGIDAFYRYAGSQFDRTLPNGLLEDNGDFHTVGVKATFDKTFSKNSRWYWFAGLGVGYFKSRRFQVDDDGIAGFAELGTGYMLSNALRIRLGLNVHAMDTSTGRMNPAQDDDSRMLWLFAPTLGFDLDF
jgi:hypothetical protein